MEDPRAEVDSRHDLERESIPPVSGAPPGGGVEGDDRKVGGVTGVGSRFFHRRRGTVLFLILLVAGLTRLGAFGLNRIWHPTFFSPDLARIEAGLRRGAYVHPFGFEISNVAYSWVCGEEGFSSPFGGNTGPTGWVSPGITGLYSLSFRLFGCFTTGSRLFLFAVALVLSLLMTALLVPLGGAVLGNRGWGLGAAFLFAIAPYDVYLFVRPSQLDFNVYAFLVVASFSMLLWFRRKPTWQRALPLALISGLALLFNPVFLGPVLVSSGVVLGIGSRGASDESREGGGEADARGWIALGPLGLFLLVVLLVVGPYLIYQRAVLGQWVFVKTNGPFEMYLGNQPGVGGMLTRDDFQAYHPSRNRGEFESYRRLGEVGYVKARFAEFRRRFRPVDFLRDSGRRILYAFFLYEPEAWDAPGVKLRLKYAFYALPGLTLLGYVVLKRGRLKTAEALLYLYVLSYSLPFFLTAVMKRYLFPVTPLILLLLAAILGSALEAWWHLRRPPRDPGPGATVVG